MIQIYNLIYHNVITKLKEPERQSRQIALSSPRATPEHPSTQLNGRRGGNSKPGFVPD